MTALTDISPGVAGLQTRLVIETITQVVSGAEIVEIVGSLDETIPGFEAESWSIPGSEHALTHIRKRVVGLLGAQNCGRLLLVRRLGRRLGRPGRAHRTSRTATSSAPSSWPARAGPGRAGSGPSPRPSGAS